MGIGSFNKKVEVPNDSFRRGRHPSNLNYLTFSIEVVRRNEFKYILGLRNETVWCIINKARVS